mgnify:CR=1 FL=1
MPVVPSGLTLPWMLKALKASTLILSFTLSENENTLYKDISVSKFFGPCKIVCEYGLVPAGPGEYATETVVPFFSVTGT